MTSNVQAPIEYIKIPTGVEGLDVMLGGGFPKGRVVLFRGAPGVGKTIFSAQFLYNGALKYNEKGLFVSLEETREHLIREMYLVGMELRTLLENGMLTFIDASPIRQIPPEVKLGTMAVGKRDFSLVALAKKIKDVARQNAVKRIVIDPLTALSIQYTDENQRRTMVLDLIEILSETGATCVMTEELRTNLGPTVGISTEDYSVHGVIIMRPLTVRKTRTRTIQIVKMRESRHDDQTRIYRIDEHGIVVYPKENVFAEDPGK